MNKVLIKVDAEIPEEKKHGRGTNLWHNFVTPYWLRVLQYNKIQSL